MADVPPGSRTGRVRAVRSIDAASGWPGTEYGVGKAKGDQVSPLWAGGGTAAITPGSTSASPAASTMTERTRPPRRNCARSTQLPIAAPIPRRAGGTRAASQSSRDSGRLKRNRPTTL